MLIPTLILLLVVSESCRSSLVMKVRADTHNTSRRVRDLKVEATTRDPEATTMDPDETLATIQHYTKILEYDCGPNGTFQYCPNNFVCTEHDRNGSPVYNLYKRSNPVCDPYTTMHYGCHCIRTSMLKGQCSPRTCLSLMKEFGVVSV